MSTGAITGYIDVAQVVLYVFWIFFAGLIFYLRREDRREGYPLESDPTGKVKDKGFLYIPEPKTFVLAHGGTSEAPDFKRDDRPLAVKRTAAWPGAPLEPTGNPMTDAVGPASYAERADTPDLTLEGEPKIVPMRTLGDFSIASNDPDPRGKPVMGADGVQAGTVKDAWVDRSEILIRYYEVELAGDGAKSVLLPAPCARVNGKGTVSVNAILASQFADVPATAKPDQVTLLEEDRIVGYYAGGNLYATSERLDPLI